MLGASYAELGRAKEAKAQFDQVLKKDPDSIPALVGLANILMREGKTDDVVTLSKRTLSMDPRNSQAYTLLGEVYLDQRQPAKALPHLEKAVEIQPKITQNRLNLAACLIDVQQFGRAEQVLREIVDEHPRFPGARFNQGVLFEEQGRIEEARTAYLAEVANYPHSFKARFNLGKILAGLGDWTGSNAQMREIVRIAPERAEGYLFLARGLLHERSPLDEIQGLAEKGLTLADTSELKALGWFLLADVFERRNQPDKVSVALRNARHHASQPK
jgi:tetratricopeptide (TPR) repeat protein